MVASTTVNGAGSGEATVSCAAKMVIAVHTTAIATAGDHIRRAHEGSSRCMRHSRPAKAGHYQRYAPRSRKKPRTRVQAVACGTHGRLKPHTTDGTRNPRRTDAARGFEQLHAALTSG